MLKRKHLIIEILIFTVVSVSALLLFKGVSKKIETELKGFEEFLYTKLKTEAGIKVEYESLSPSILPHFSFKNIQVKDAQTDVIVADFKYFSVNYNLIELLRSNYGKVVKSVDIKNGGIYFDTTENAELLKKISTLLKSDSNVSKQEEVKEDNKQKNNKEFRLTGIEVNLSNIKLAYTDKISKSEFNIFSGSIYSENDRIFYELNSKCIYSNNKIKILKNLSLNLNIQGNVSSDFLFSSSIITMENIQFSNFETDKLSFFVSYKDSVISARSFQKNRGLGIVASMNTKSNIGGVSLNFNKFMPAKLITNSKMNISLNEILHTKLSGETKVKFNLSESGNPSLEWLADLTATSKKIELNKANLHNTKLKIKGNGTQDFIQIHNFSLNSNELNFNGNLSYNFKNNNTLAHLNLESLKLKSGSISSKLKLTNSGSAFICDINNIALGKANFSGGKITATPKEKQLDFSFLLKDETGSYELDGSYTYANKARASEKGFIEIHGVLNAINVQNLYKSVATFSSKGANIRSISRFKPFRITSEFYASTDLKDFSYNFVQFIFASVEKNGLNLLTSFNGNNSSLSVNNIDIGYRDVEISGKANADIESYNNMSFDLSFLVDSIMYSATGMYSDGMLEIYGDYNFALNIYEKKDKYEGSFHVSELPIPVTSFFASKGKATPFVFSTDVNFEWRDEDNWNFTCPKADFVYSKSNIKTNNNIFELSFKAEGTQKESTFYDIKIGNETSFLQGDATVSHLYADNDAKESFIASLDLSDTEKTEAVKFKSNISLSELNDVYIDAKCTLDNLSLNRFFWGQSETDKIDCEVDFIGGLENFLCNINLDTLEFHLNNKPLVASGIFSLDDGSLVIPDARFYWNDQSITEFTLSFLPKEGTGDIKFDYSGHLGQNEVGGKVDIKAMKINASEEEEGLPAIAIVKNFFEEFSVNFSVNDWYFGEKTETKPLLLSIFRAADQVSFYGGENDEIYGFYMNDGSLTVEISEKLENHASINGLVLSDKLEIDCNNILLNIPQIMRLLSIENFVTMTDGNLNGNLSLRGTPKNPEFFGKLNLDNLKFFSPDFAPTELQGNNIPIHFTGTSLELPYTVFTSKKFGLWAECTSQFEGWIPENTVVKCGTLEENFAYMKTKNLLFHTDGYASCDLIMTIKPKQFNLQGDVLFASGSFAIAFGDFDKFREKFKYSDIDFSMNLALQLGKKAEFRWPNMNMPMLRALTPTEKPIVFKVGEETETLKITGIANMRGGELLYIKRNFYIKEGSIRFLENAVGIEPLISLRAEIRDQDLNGEQIKLILSVKEQPLIGSSDEWISNITTYPPRSATEVRQLLGQVIVGDTDKETAIQDALTNATDILSQLGFAKKAENTVRDFLHLDVFSLRTQILQNVVFGNMFKNQTKTDLKAGNYLDNTTLYIGKYLGSAIYADALLNLSYYDPLKDKNPKQKKPVWKSVLFQPEIGLEMVTPFFNFRWAISPTDPNTLFVADTSITFSWKFEY